jgi:foldase protein PrsA
VTKINRRSPLFAGVLVGLVALGAAGLLLLSGCGDDSSSLPDGVVARVGDAPITEKQLTTTIEQSRAQAKEQGQTLPAEGEDGYDQVRQQALQQLIQQEVVSSEARKCGKPCAVTPADITAELARIREANFNGSQKEFDAFLKKSAITKAGARDIVENQLQQQKLLNHVTRGVRFTAADAREYYDANPDQFTVAAGRTARHILVADKAKADAIRAEVTSGNFAELAKENSTDTGSAEQDGDLGQIQKGQLVPEFEKVAFALKDGEISDPVKTQFGWHIISVEITPASTTSFEEAKSQIISSQLSAKRQEAWTAWGEETLKAAEERTVYASDDLKPATTTAEAPVTAPQTTTTP